MGELSMRPGAVRRCGEKADDVGAGIWAQHRRLAASGEESGPGSGFAVDAAFGAFAFTWTGVVSELGSTVGQVGANLVGSAATVTARDADAAGEIGDCWRRDRHVGPSARTPYYGRTTRPRR